MNPVGVADAEIIRKITERQKEKSERAKDDRRVVMMKAF